MRKVRYLSVLALIASLAFLAAVSMTRSRQRSAEASIVESELPIDAPDSLRLASIGLRPGRQLIVYFFGGSRCGHCRRPEVKSAIAALRDSLRHVHGDGFATIAVVGVAINTDVEEGLAYLRSIGLSGFDEVSVGKGWQNEQVVRWIRRDRVADSAVPLLIAITRGMQANLAPLTVAYTTDSIVAVQQGARAIVDWVAGGVTLETPRPAVPPTPQKRDIGGGTARKAGR